jgi:hypothetical protein
MQSEHLKKRLAKCRFLARLLRHRFVPSDFHPLERLYRRFRIIDQPDPMSELRANSFSFPNISCNWSRFSKPKDVRKIPDSLPTDGCYSFTIEQARYEGMVNACHDPFPITNKRNYAHTELRQLKPGEGIAFEPPGDRAKLEKAKDGWSNAKKLAYRQYISLNLKREIEPLA